MALEIQVSRTQKIVSRVIIALLLLGVLAMPLFNLGHVDIAKAGDITTYTSSASLFFSIQFAFLGLAACVVGVFYARQRHGFFRFVGVAVFATGLFCLLNSPTGLNHQLVVTPDYFFQRIGSWYLPKETKVEFKKVKYMSIDESDTGGSNQRRYDLRCETGPKTDEVRIEINDLLKAALPEIYRRAAEN